MTCGCRSDADVTQLTLLHTWPKLAVAKDVDTHLYIALPVLVCGMELEIVTEVQYPGSISSADTFINKGHQCWVYLAFLLSTKSFYALGCSVSLVVNCQYCMAVKHGQSQTVS